MAINAQLSWPTNVWVDTNKNIYIADYANNLIRRVDSQSGIITTIAGKPGSPDSTGDGGPATSAKLYNPQGVAVDGYGNVFIADTRNNKIRMVDSAGIITTIAGTGVNGDLGDCGMATSARLYSPIGIWVDINNNIYIADTGNNKIRMVWPQTSAIPSVCDFENVVSTSNFQYYVVGSVIGGWTTGGIYSVGLSGGDGNPGGGICIISSTNNIGFVSPFPSNLQYACWIQTINNAKASITRTLTGLVVGNAYFVSFWATCRSGSECPPSQSFTVLMDAVTVYSTSPSSTSWVLVTSVPNIALHTSMTLMFQVNNLLGGSGQDCGVAIDALALQQSTQSSTQPSSRPTTHPSKGSPTDFHNHLLSPRVLFTNLRFHPVPCFPFLLVTLLPIYLQLFHYFPLVIITCYI